MIKKFPRKIFFVGIGGSGVSGLARILHSLGHIVAGSDSSDSKAVRSLTNSGIQCIIGHRRTNLNRTYDLLVYSPAVPSSNAERKYASLTGISQLSYPEALGLLTKKYDTVAVCGTHGKTTTTALLSCVLIDADKDPAVLVGAPLKELNGYNNRVGEGKYFIIEACEYRRAFLNYSPKIIIVTNIEADHLDYYRDIDDYTTAFKQFLSKLPPDGTLIANADDKRVMAILPKGRRIITYGSKPGADYMISSNNIIHRGKVIARLKMKIPGIHNRCNAAAVIALAGHLKLNPVKTVNSLNNYSGAERRFEIKGKIGKTILIDDYAHHPTEIRATLRSLREKFGKTCKILCIFQPHQYNRTLNLLNEFATAFSDADMLIIPNIYQVRDKQSDLKKIDENSLVKKIAEHHNNVIWGGGLKKSAELATGLAKEFDVVITMGAGDITSLSELLLNRPESL